MNKRNKWLALTSALAALASLPTHGNTLTPSALGFVPGVAITYGADLTSGELHPGDGFTIFDIGGFAGFGPIAPAWAPSVTAGSPFSPPAPGGIDTALPNV